MKALNKNILVIRLSKGFQNLNEDSKTDVSKKYKKVFKKEFNTVLIFGENETHKTTFEIIYNEST